MLVPIFYAFDDVGDTGSWGGGERCPREREAVRAENDPSKTYMAVRALSRDIARNAAEASALEVGRQAVGYDESSSGSFTNNMAESIVLATAWYTVRMICQASYRAIKSYRVGRKPIANTKTTEAFSPAYGGGGVGGGGCVPAISAENEANAESWVPWGAAARNTAERSSQATPSSSDDDHLWVEELRRAVDSRTSDNLRLLREIQELGDKVDASALEKVDEKLTLSMALLLEYQQNPLFREAPSTLRQAKEAAIDVCNNKRSLVMSLSALHLRIVITYIHCPKHSKGLEPSLDDHEKDKNQCEIYIANTLKQGPLESLCRRFLASRKSGDRELRERVEREAMLPFDIILEVISNVYLLEPFRPSQGPLPKSAPDIVIHALSIHCKKKLGSFRICADLARALEDWESKPERQEKWALHCLYKSTDGAGWACNEGWDRVFEADLSSLYGVSTAAGRVSKISLGANNLKGRLPHQLQNLVCLEELSLPGNKLFGNIPRELWNLPCLRVVALHGNSFTAAVPPAEKFTPATRTKPAAGSTSQDTARRSGAVVASDPGLVEVYQGEWFVCSWKITNTGGVSFAEGTKLAKGDGHSMLGGAEDVMVNPLAPGEDQTVSVMLQAPNYEAWGVKDKWALVGEGLDFVNEAQAGAHTPIIRRVVPRPAGRRSRQGGADSPTLTNTVFVAARRSSPASSQYSLVSSQYSSNSSYQGPQNSGHNRS